MAKRIRECLDCQQRYISSVKYSKYTPNISGEATEYCPRCGSRNVMSYPVIRTKEEEKMNKNQTITEMLKEITFVDEEKEKIRKDVLAKIKIYKEQEKDLQAFKDKQTQTHSHIRNEIDKLLAFGELGLPL